MRSTNRFGILGLAFMITFAFGCSVTRNYSFDTPRGTTHASIRSSAGGLVQSIDVATSSRTQYAECLEARRLQAQAQGRPFGTDDQGSCTNQTSGGTTLQPRPEMPILPYYYGINGMYGNGATTTVFQNGHYYQNGQLIQ